MVVQYSNYFGVFLSALREARQSEMYLPKSCSADRHARHDVWHRTKYHTTSTTIQLLNPVYMQP